MKKLAFPTAHTVLLIIAALVAVLTWIIPSGKYEQLEYQKTSKTEGIFLHHSQNGTIELPAQQATLDQLGLAIQLEKFTSLAIKKPVGIPGSYYPIEENPQGVVAFIQSPIKGMMGAIDVILFVLIIGGFIGLINYTGAFDAGVLALAKNLKGREMILIIIITCLIALGGTTFGLAEETIAFYPILVPVFLAAGYDAMVALGAIYIGSSIGTMASTVNPFSAIIASDAAGISWTSGIYGRLFMLIVGTSICLWYIIRYAEKVRKDPSQSLIYDQKEEIEALFLKKESKEVAFTGRIKIILIIFLFSFLVMIFGVAKLDWWFLKMTTVFFVAAIIIGLVAGIKEKIFVREFVKGASDLLSVAIIIGIARGITIIMDDGAISDTLLFQASSVVDGMPKWLFANVMMFLYAGLSFFIPSSSGMAVLSMPIMAPLADIVAAPREVVVDAYQFGMGLMAFVTPTGLILASLTMVNVTYDKWLKFVSPLLAILTVLSMLFLTVQAYS